MNKLLLAALLGFVLVVVTASGEEESADTNLVASAEADLIQSREAREAGKNDGKNKRKGKKRSKKNRKLKKGKSKKAKKNKKRKNKKKKALKKKKSGKGRKSRKNKKKGLKKKKSGKGKKSRKNKKNKKVKKNKSKKSKRKNKKKGKKSAKKSRKSKKSRKGKKKSKKNKKAKRKNKKNKRKNKKNKRKNKKNKRKNKKNKKSKRKNKKNKKGGKKSKKSMKARSQTCRAADDECLAKAVSYLNKAKEKVTNFGKQKARIEKYKKLTGNKGNKKSIFIALLNRVREAGGGNSSNLKCQGSTTNEGAKQMKSISEKLGKCEASINASCSSPPAHNDTLAKSCNETMTSFSTEINKCINKTTSTDKCTCWKSDTLATLAKKVAACDLVKTNKNFIAHQKKCTKAFSACRQVEDMVSGVIFTCSKANTPSKLITRIKGATKTKTELEALKKAASAKVTKQMRERRAAACSAYPDMVKKVAMKATDNPGGPKLDAEIKKVTEEVPASCTTTEKTALKAVIDGVLTAAISELESFITLMQKDLTTITGSTASAAVISAATFPGGAGGSVTTKKPKASRQNRYHF